MPKQVGDYILDCLRAMNKDEGEVELGKQISAVRQYWHDLWGGAVPQASRIIAAFISNDPVSKEPKDLWFFSTAHCLVARNLTSGSLDLFIYPFKDGIRRMRIAKNYGDQPDPGSRFAVALWFDEDSKVVIEAAAGNCISLETLLEEVLVPRLQ
jgi:hypothetical protein